MLRKGGSGASTRRVTAYAPKPLRLCVRYGTNAPSREVLGSKIDILKQSAGTTAPRAGICTTTPIIGQPAARLERTPVVSRLDVLKQALAEDAAGKTQEAISAVKKAVELEPEAYITLHLRIGDKVQIIHARVGDTLLDAAHVNAVNVDGTCDGELACSTCHVVIDPDAFVRAKAISSLESDLLESAFDVGPMSRLACQVTVTQEMDG
eukprot:COSAG05_NODE_4441_length_1513_cov_2.023338_1_plen_207_part_10